MRTRFHVLAGLLVCLTALAASPIWWRQIVKNTSTTLPDASSATQSKPRPPRNFKPDLQACGPTVYAIYVTDDQEYVSRVSYGTKSLRKDFEKELRKAGRVLKIERTPDEHCQVRALIEHPKGGMTLLLQYGSRIESSGVVVKIQGATRDIVEEFEAIEEEPRKPQPVFSKSMAYTPPSTGH